MKNAADGAAAAGALAGRTCLVTGATSGIGEEIALGLARAGARVAIVGRNRERGERSLARVKRESGNLAAELLLADLASGEQVRELAARVLERFGELHVLVNNAGIVNLRRETTADGLEATFAINHLAVFQLTLLLLERLRASAPARVVNVASHAHKFGGALDFGDLQNERRYRSMKVYAQSKTANILFSLELARRLEGTGVTVNCLHPGAVATRLGQQNGAAARLLTRALRVFFRTPTQGADTALWLASAPELAATSGRYFYDRRETQPAPHARDGLAAARLFELSAQLAGLPLPAVPPPPR